MSDKTLIPKIAIVIDDKFSPSKNEEDTPALISGIIIVVYG